MKKILMGLIIPLFTCNSYSQNVDSIKIFDYQNKIKIHFQNLYKLKDDKEKQIINDSIIALFDSCLNISSSFEYPFDSIKYTGKIYSHDKNLRIISWNIPLQNSTNKYYGYIQYKKSDKEIINFKLKSYENNNIIPEDARLPLDKWYGALYYEIIDVTGIDNNKYYVLLGLDYKDLFISRKIIDALYFENDKPFLGLPVFYYNSKWVNRIVFEYSARVSMMLRYEKNKNLIVFDHLSPSSPYYTGKFQYYGPDFSYDALILESGKWKEVKDIDIRNIY